MAVGIVVAVVFIQEGQRRIPIQYAKRMVGRRMTTGGSTYMPLRVNMAGVIPVIFAAAVMASRDLGAVLPQTQSFSQVLPRTPTGIPVAAGRDDRDLHVFYTAVQFNPVDRPTTAEARRYIPGIRPGPPTAQYLDQGSDAADAAGRHYWRSWQRCRASSSRTRTSRSAGGRARRNLVLIAVGVALDTMPRWSRR